MDLLIIMTKSVELSEEQESWTEDELIEYAEDLVSNGAINFYSSDLEVKVVDC